MATKPASEPTGPPQGPVSWQRLLWAFTAVVTTVVFIWGAFTEIADQRNMLMARIAEVEKAAAAERAAMTREWVVEIRSVDTRVKTISTRLAALDGRIETAVKHKTEMDVMVRRELDRLHRDIRRPVSPAPYQGR